jgi:large subunit ribosomal protein L29
VARELEAHKVRELNLDEVEATLSDLRKKQFTLRMRNSMGQLENPLDVRNVRRDIAVLMTVLSERKRAALSKDEG